MLAVSVPIRSPGELEVFPSTLPRSIQKGILIVYRADHIHAGRNGWDGKAITVLHCDIGDATGAAGCGFKFQYDAAGGADLLQASKKLTFAALGGSAAGQSLRRGCWRGSH